MQIVINIDGETCRINKGVCRSISPAVGLEEKGSPAIETCLVWSVGALRLGEGGRRLTSTGV